MGIGIGIGLGLGNQPGGGSPAGSSNGSSGNSGNNGATRPVRPGMTRVDTPPVLPPGLARRLERASSEATIERRSFDVRRPLELNARTVTRKATPDVTELRRAVAEYSKQAMNARLAAQTNEAAILLAFPAARLEPDQPLRLEGYMRLRTDLREAAEAAEAATEQRESATDEADDTGESRGPVV
ncbi:MAG: hypothetical protein AB7F65_03615 [Dehalococcoidia bacterium]